MSKFLDSIQGRDIFVDEVPEFEETVAKEPSSNLKVCLICGKPFIKSRAKYCNRQHYVSCLVCGNKIAITSSHINGVVPKTCSKTCADTLGVQTYKANCLQKYGVTNPMLVPDLAKDMVAKRNPNFDFSLKEEQQVRECEVCGKDFIFDYTHPRRCCSDECSIKLRKSSIISSVKICKLCGKPFNPASNTSMYCDGPHYRKCAICGKQFKLVSNDSTAQTCSAECRDRLYRRTCMERYGVEIGSQSTQARDKLSIAGKKNNPKHSDKNTTKLPTIKLCKICNEPFSITSNAQLICNKQHYRNCDVCGKQYPYNRPWTQLCCSDECTRKKRENTIESRYGTPYPLQNEQLKEKAENTSLIRFGVKHAAQSEYIKQKTVDNNMKKYGYPWPAQSSTIKDKVKESCKQKYGVESVMQLDRFKRKGEEGCLKKYGVRRPMQSRDIHIKMSRNRKNIRAIDGTPLDSLYEKQVYDFCKLLGLSIERNIPIQFEYEGKCRTTFIDFRIDGLLFEVKGLPYLQGVYDYAQLVPIDKKLQIYRENHVILITDYAMRDLFGHKDSTESNGLKHLDICPNPLIGVDIKLFDDTVEFPYADNKPKCFYDVSVNGRPSQYSAFNDNKTRWEIIKNRIQYVGGFIDAKEILVGLNVTRKAKQPSWFSKSFAEHLISTYCTCDTIVDPFAGWGTRHDAAVNLKKKYIGCDLNPELVAWHTSCNRNITCEDATNFKYGGKCSVFTCPPYSDTEIYFEGQKILDECSWFDIIIKNIPNASEYVMVCHQVSDKYKPFIVETKENKSHFGSNTEYVVVVKPEEIQ